MTQTMRIPWVNGGEAFRLHHKMFSAEDQLAIRRAYTDAKLEVKRRLTGLAVKDVKEVQNAEMVGKVDPNTGRAIEPVTLEDEVMADAIIQCGCTVVRRALMRVDPKVRDLSESEVIDRLSVEDFQQIMMAIKPQEEGIVRERDPRRQASKTTKR